MLLFFLSPLGWIYLEAQLPPWFTFGFHRNHLLILVFKIFMYACMYLAMLGLSCGMLDLAP